MMPFQNISKSAMVVKKGGILSPLCFNLYMGEISKNLSNENVGCCVNSNVINHIMYADDLCLLAPSAKLLQCLINICSKYASDHDIVYNVKKAVCMLVKSNKFNLINLPCIKLGKTQLKYVTEYKYLSCIVTDNLGDNKDVQKTLRYLC